MFSSNKGVVHAVDGVSFHIMQQETFGLVGESGCGKSTLSRIILHLLKPDSGEILMDGQNVQNMSRQERAQMRMVFQNPFASLNPKEKVFDIIAEPYRINSTLSKQEITKEVMRLMDCVGLNQAYAARYPHEFSGGQRQRIGIARALAMQPRFIVCDEPVSALDVSIQAQILNLLKEIQAEFGLTYLFISHNLSVVKYMAQRIAVMYLGRIMEEGDAEELYRNPMHPYTKALLSAIPGNTLYNENGRILLSGDLPSPINPPSGCRFRTRCPYAEERCAAEEPQFHSVNDGHKVACHLYAKEMEE